MNARKVFVRPRLSCVLVQTFVRSPDFRAFIFRLSCVHVQSSVPSPDFRVLMFSLSRVHVQTFVRSPNYSAFMLRLSCVHVQTFVRSYSEFHAFFDVFRLSNFERTTPLRAFIFGLDIFVSVWHLSVGVALKKIVEINCQPVISKDDSLYSTLNHHKLNCTSSCQTNSKCRLLISDIFINIRKLEYAKSLFKKETALLIFRSFETLEIRVQ